MVGKHGSRWPVQEAERLYSQPQTQSKKIKLEVGPGCELSKPFLHDILSPARLNHKPQQSYKTWAKCSSTHIYRG